MLLIGQPKSASTSLLKTLAKMFKVKYQNGLGKDIGWKYCEGFKEIQKYHDTTIKRNEAFLKTWMVKRTIILKEHILPTKEHKEIIKKVNTKILILLRKPEDSFDNYVRLYNSYKKNKLSKESIQELVPFRLEKMHMYSFLDDLKDFNKGWREFDYEKKLIITFEDLILNYRKTIIKIFNFWDFKLPKKILPLFKSKGNHGYNTYTGVGEKRLKEELK
jgi:hypothetical protein